MMQRPYRQSAQEHGIETSASQSCPPSIIHMNWELHFEAQVHRFWSIERTNDRPADRCSARGNVVQLNAGDYMIDLLRRLAVSRGWLPAGHVGHGRQVTISLPGAVQTVLVVPPGQGQRGKTLDLYILSIAETSS